MKKVLCAFLFLAAFGIGSNAYAQFSSNLQGTVIDQSGAVIPKAELVLTNTGTGISDRTTAGAKGGFQFPSLAPGSYTLSISARGFATKEIPVILHTAQTMGVTAQLSVGSSRQAVRVSARGPVLDPADSRTEMTLGTQALQSLPLPSRSVLNFVAMAPGVTGLGTVGHGNRDNFAAETDPSISANGRSSVGDTYIVDGLDITSDITPGVLNTVPNPDTLQEVSVQVNTFSAVYGRSSSIVTVMTTKSGTKHFHGLISDYFTNQTLTAGTEFVHNYAPFHSDNISATLGGPIPGLHRTFFFSAVEPLLSLTSTGNRSYTFEAPQFVKWAQQNYPNTLGTQLLTKYPASSAIITGVAQTAGQVYPGTCGTSATDDLPCSTPVFDSGVFNASDYRNGLQWNTRIDKYFHKNRLYGNFFDTTLHEGGPVVRLDMASPSQRAVRSVQINETHTFSSNALNEAAFGFLRLEGLTHPTGLFSIPVINVEGMNTGIGVGQAHLEYVQHHYVWRDSFMFEHGNHNLQFGTEGFHGDNLTYFGPWFSQPVLTFTGLLSLVQDQPYSEGGVAYNPLTGQQAGVLGGSFRYTGTTFGIYAQDTWRVTRDLTLNYGLRWDNFGNPTPEDGSVLANFFMGPGETLDQQIANGYVKQEPHVFNHAITAFSPRVGVAWDPTGHGKWVLRGGIGLYHDWITLGNVQNEFGNPPASVTTTFITGTTAPPIFDLGTSNSFPFGFQYPTFTKLGLNSHGGFTGEQVNIAANNPNLTASDTYNYTITVARALGNNYDVSAGYSGSHSINLFTGFANHVGNAYYGFDINTLPDSLIINDNVLVRLNPSFGSIRYTQNGARSNYNAFIVAFKGRIGGRGFINTSYTHSSSWDDAGDYPTSNYQNYYSPSNWNAPNRLSLMANYDLAGFPNAIPGMKGFTSGWELSGDTVLQSGNPFTVLNTAPFEPIFNSQGQVVGEQPGGGDYNADGKNLDYPDAPSFGYHQPTSRQAYLHGIFTASAFPTPAFGTEGNEKPNRYHNPGYADTDVALIKNTHLYENANLQLRFELYNVFNHPNLGGVDNKLNSSSFGESTSQLNPRFIQLGARITF